MIFFFQERCYVAYFIKSTDSLIILLSLAFKVKIFKNKQKLYIFPCCVQLFATMPGFLVFLHLPEFAQTEQCYLSISPSVAHFSSRSQYFPASGSFPKTQLFAYDSQSIGASASASVLPMNIQGWSLLGLPG